MQDIYRLQKKCRNGEKRDFIMSHPSCSVLFRSRFLVQKYHLGEVRNSYEIREENERIQEVEQRKGIAKGVWRTWGMRRIRKWNKVNILYKLPCQEYTFVI